METCMLLCFHVHIYRKTCMFPCNFSIECSLLTPLEKGPYHLIVGSTEWDSSVLSGEGSILYGTS